MSSSITQTLRIIARTGGGIDPSTSKTEPREIIHIPNTIPQEDTLNSGWRNGLNKRYRIQAENNIRNHAANTGEVFALVHHLMKNGLPFNIADFGTFQGASLRKMYASMNQILTEYPDLQNTINITGIDCVEGNIVIAHNDRKLKQLIDHKAAKFIHVPSMALLPDEYDGYFSGIRMDYVDQVIPYPEANSDKSYDYLGDYTLYFNLSKLYNSLMSGGILLIQRLHQSSFDPSKRYALYGHSEHNHHESLLKDGQLFTNELKSTTCDPTESLIFQDTFRRSNVILKLLKKAGFTNRVSIPLGMINQGIITQGYIDHSTIEMVQDLFFHTQQDLSRKHKFYQDPTLADGTHPPQEPTTAAKQLFNFFQSIPHNIKHSRRVVKIMLIMYYRTSNLIVIINHRNLTIVY